MAGQIISKLTKIPSAIISQNMDNFDSLKTSDTIFLILLKWTKSQIRALLSSRPVFHSHDSVIPLPAF